LQNLLAELGFVAYLYPIVREAGVLKYFTLRSARLLSVMDYEPSGRVPVIDRLD
jgi:hypothetical protein